MKKVKKILILLLLIIFNTCLTAQTVNFIKYETADNNYETKISEKVFNNYKYQIALSMKKMLNCQEYKNNIFNPIYGVNMHYNTLGKNKKGKCVIDINNNSLINYRCAIEENLLKRIVDSKIKNIKNNYNLEDTNDYENKIYNNKKYCKKKIIKVIPNKTKEAEKEIKNNPKLQKLIQFFN